jgi:hypothetical protein
LLVLDEVAMDLSIISDPGTRHLRVKVAMRGTANNITCTYYSAIKAAQFPQPW